MEEEEYSSYPPVFRHIGGHSSAAHGGGGAILPSVDLPVVDFQDLRPAALGEICREWGIFRLVNHGIPPSLSRRLHDEAKRLISLPFELKQTRFAGDPVTYFFGTPAAASPSGESTGGLAEEFGAQSSAVARELFETLAEDLGLAGERRASSFSGAGKLLRLHRYPFSPLAGGHLGMDAHTDSSLLTLVSDGDVGGLQILHGGAWLAVDPLPGSLLVNLGDMMQAISDDQFKSVKHRVQASNGEERISICFFAFPPEDRPIRSSRYREFTYRDFKAKVQEDIQAVGFKVGLDRFRI
ncbi:unnamed protein product [Spirodela intermedia]|uniref:Fe2OG dioxygenase domain-containing protein n=1 Tax=Spirodela intermedia TaxID=51605 RepID=A0A7I8IVI3_SPIIN|nr:unnamed protein product [Spirodela intermedia]CAA6661828.1 unnamed protein product [Spirodela intermedia]